MSMNGIANIMMSRSLPPPRPLGAVRSTREILYSELTQTDSNTPAIIMQEEYTKLLNRVEKLENTIFTLITKLNTVVVDKIPIGIDNNINTESINLR